MLLCICARDRMRGGFELEASASPLSSEADLEVHKIIGDGRCLFRAVARGLAINRGQSMDVAKETTSADELRNRVADALPSYRKMFEEFSVLEGHDFDDYASRIRHPAAWGGEPELLILADILETPIHVYIRDRTGKLASIQQYGSNFQTKTVHPVRVLYNGNSHYDLLCGELRIGNKQ
mmetsp:Transcript_27015/g.45333  ORF Transcript_27015/g.45333 Transcript_27015/m.45333 type:complete len:179 (+) Transcript_27015:24-560(+)